MNWKYHLIIWRYRILQFLWSSNNWIYFKTAFHTQQMKAISRIRSTRVSVYWCLRLMQRYFSQICDGTDVQADGRSCTYGRAPNVIDISQGSLTCPSYTDTGPPFLYGDSDTPPHLVAFYDMLGIRRMYSRLTPGVLTGEVNKNVGSK